jgi:hypothetical protein
VLRGNAFISQAVRALALLRLHLLAVLLLQQRLVAGIEQLVWCRVKRSKTYAVMIAQAARGDGLQLRCRCWHVT